MFFVSSFLCLSGTAQIVGLKFDPYHFPTEHSDGIYASPLNYDSMGYSSGCFFEKKIYSNLSLSLGLNYFDLLSKSQNHFAYPWHGSSPPQFYYNEFNRYNGFEIPVDLSLTLAKNKRDNIKLIGQGEFALEYLLYKIGTRVYYDNHVVFDTTYLNDISINKIGFRIKIKADLTKRICISIGYSVDFYNEVNTHPIFQNTTSGSMALEYCLARKHKE